MKFSARETFCSHKKTPDTEEITIATNADDTSSTRVGNNMLEATNKLQKSINSANKWMKKW